MVLPINNFNRISFAAENTDAKKESSQKHDEDKLLKNNMLTRAKISVDKFSNAFTLYPAKGIKGSKNANFYEFLTMGIFPYFVGSAMLMAVFNSATKHFDQFARQRASAFGKRMAMGVIFYGLAKEISKGFVTKPVKWLTGVDTELPYKKVVKGLPESVDDGDLVSYEYHKVFESSDFARWDLLYKEGDKRNSYYDKIAKKNGYGNNLTDSDQEIKPRIKEIVTKTTTAKNISSYLWAAVGVGIGVQENWTEFMSKFSLKSWKGAKETGSSLLYNLKKSVKNFYKGKEGPKYAGKALLFTALASSAIGVLNVMISRHRPSKLNAESVIKKDEKSVVV